MLVRQRMSASAIFLATPVAALFVGALSVAFDLRVVLFVAAIVFGWSQLSGP